MEYTIHCPKTYRYFTSGDLTKAKYVLYVLHGYGQLAEYFIQKFNQLDSDFFIVAPEGMHRFYLKGSSGRVGASWMTKEARESDMADTLQWLETLDSEFSCQKSFEKKIVLGFSQGGATAARWSSYGKNKPDHIIYWASVYPPDLEVAVQNENNEMHHFVLGNHDEYFNSDQQKSILHFYSEKGYNTHVYNGNHSIETTILSTILSIVKKKIQLDEK